jgi:uncharacterized protein (DUF1697 family)
MKRYAAFLRGINLGRRRVTGEQLRAPFLGLGLAGVETFLASGNVVFEAEGGASEGELEARIEGALESSLGLRATTFLRSAAEVAAMAARSPFSGEEPSGEGGKLQVILLPAEPGPEAAATALVHASEEDRLALHGRELYWLPQGLMSASALDLGALDKLVGPTTIRTANTIGRLYSKFFEAMGP